ncbi:MAG: hypothetical protein WC871_02165, partial [Bacteroidales bacterium]
DKNGGRHIIDTDVTIEAIKTAHPTHQVQIAKKLTTIDFHNGDVNHFLKYLAQGLVNINYAGGQ